MKEFRTNNTSEAALMSTEPNNKSHEYGLKILIHTRIFQRTIPLWSEKATKEILIHVMLFLNGIFETLLVIGSVDRMDNGFLR